MATTADELASVLEQLTPAEQERVLDFARHLADRPVFPRTPLPPGTPGHVVATLRVSAEAGEAMETALEDTEQIWPDE